MREVALAAHTLADSLIGAPPPKRPSGSLHTPRGCSGGRRAVAGKRCGALRA
jgi:hypothetical protein